MQTDILLKQLYSSLSELKTSIEKFEKHPSPSTQYTEQLHVNLNQTNKLVSAYLVLKEQKDISPELNLHVKLMSAPQQEEKKVVIEQINEPEIKPSEEVKVVEEIKLSETEPIKTATTNNTENSITQEIPQTKNFPSIIININDKFIFINELFAANSNEYNIAIEQINNTNSIEELTTYLNGLTSIYSWNEDHEIVKKLFSLAKKRFS
jgi:hypothetical protein